MIQGKAQPASRRLPRLLLGMALAAACLPAAATETVAPLTLRLHPVEGEALELGTVSLTPEGDGRRFRVDWDERMFENHFLSMRPFQCLQRGEHMLCHLPYPYENPRLIEGDDLTDLEYDLLFIRKAPDEYGIDPWNGVYYRLHWNGETIEGELMEVDMNLLASPPPPGVRRPITAEDLHPADPDNHWLPRLSIR